jgi:hypothetical protein
MAAAKGGNLGATDAQDYILVGKNDTRDTGDWERARLMCELTRSPKWANGRIDGIVRMEAGFEIIYCDFDVGGGLDLVSVIASPFANETDLPVRSGFGSGFEWIRAVAQRYEGFEQGRIIPDFSSMVSAFWYTGLNLTNPDATRPELPRLVNSTKYAHDVILKDIAKSVRHQSTSWYPVGWQGATDRVVSLFGARLQTLALPSTSEESMRTILASLVHSYVDFASPLNVTAAVAVCASRHLDRLTFGRTTWTQADKLIFTALETVTMRICEGLFSMQALLVADDEQGARTEAQDLANWLDWARWRGCGGRSSNCENEGTVCFVSHHGETACC